jgi:hypothetical protein
VLLARAAVACVPSALKSNDRGRKDVNVPVSGLSKLLAGRRVTSVLLRVDAEKIEHSNNVISEDTFRKSDVEVGKYVPMTQNQSDKSGKKLRDSGNRKKSVFETDFGTCEIIIINLPTSREASEQKLGSIAAWTRISELFSRTIQRNNE